MGILDSVYEAITSAARYVYEWLRDLFVALYDAFVAGMLAILPDDFEAPFTALVGYIGAANAWVPFDYGASLLVAYFTFQFFVISFRWIKSFIPTISN